jgi:glycosyltransferase involved in cell wall biosynthesis
MINIKRISTVIPTFNREVYLKKAIQSCLAQTLNHEIIVCNHGGTDGTDKMIQEFNGKIKYIKKAKNHGPHYCWLEGVMEASGEYINLLFDDDWIEPSYLEKTMKYFDNDDIGFVFSSANVFDDKNQKVLYTMQNEFLFKSGVYEIDRYEAYFLRNLISPTSLIIRKKDMIDALYVGNLPLSKNNYRGVGPDKLMTLLCMLRYSKFGYSAEALVYYRSHQNSITIDSQSSKKKTKLLKLAYAEVDQYYYALKWVKYSQLFKWGKNCALFYNKIFFYLRFLVRKIVNILNQTLKSN